MLDVIIAVLILAAFFVFVGLIVLCVIAQRKESDPDEIIYNLNIAGRNFGEITYQERAALKIALQYRERSELNMQQAQASEGQDRAHYKREAYKCRLIAEGMLRSFNTITGHNVRYEYLDQIHL